MFVSLHIPFLRHDQTEKSATYNNHSLILHALLLQLWTPLHSHPGGTEGGNCFGWFHQRTIGTDGDHNLVVPDYTVGFDSEDTVDALVLLGLYIVMTQLTMNPRKSSWIVFCSCLVFISILFNSKVNPAEEVVANYVGIY